VFAGIEFFVGVEPFFPRNEVTYLIYKSKDIAGHTAYRIPSFFNNSHSYAGAVMVTLPLLLGLWSRGIAGHGQEKFWPLR